MIRTVIIDVESAGLEIGKHPVIQIAALAVGDDWQPIDEPFEVKVQFDPASASPGSLELNSYDAATWEADAVSPLTACRWFGHYLSTHASIAMISQRGKPYKVARVCGHNISGFDLPALRHMFKECGEFLPISFNGMLDTLALARWASWSSCEQPSKINLGALCKDYGIDAGEARDALADVLATAKLAPLLVRDFAAAAMRRAA